MKSDQDQSSSYHHGDLREVLISKALETIEARGVEAVSLRALARDIGVSHAAPMRHFPTRSALLAAIAQNGITSLIGAAARQARSTRLTSRDKLQAMAEGYVDWAISNPVHHMLIRNQDVMRHADQTLRDDIMAYAHLHEQTIVLAQQDGWRSDEVSKSIFLELTALTAGLALVASDPIYVTVFKGRPRRAAIKSIISKYFATGND
ncbi:MAG: TetR/AcrR family transcriptional regulator [Filomicrobium sp.]